MCVFVCVCVCVCVCVVSVGFTTCTFSGYLISQFGGCVCTTTLQIHGFLCRISILSSLYYAGLHAYNVGF